MKGFEDYGSEPSSIADLKGSPLTPEMLNEAFQKIRDQGGRLPERVLSMEQYERARYLAIQVRTGGASDEEILELRLLIGV